MILKSRVESCELLILRSLNARTELDADWLNRLANAEKGYEGECAFDEWTGAVSGDVVVLQDLLLDCRSTTFQIDSLMLMRNDIYLFEVKNSEGDFLIDDERWLSCLTGKEINNPLIQLKRTESSFRRLLQEHGCRRPVKSFLVFINPEFQLYQAPSTLPAIFHSQLPRFFAGIKNRAMPAAGAQDAASNAALALAEKLNTLHITDNPYKRLPEYNYETLRKGVLCPSCERFYVFEQSRRFLICHGCGKRESNPAAVLRSVNEFQLLFPSLPVTVRIIYEWCGNAFSRKVIQKTLQSHYVMRGETKAAYYEEKKEN
ncbi:nuclease-related domain-containing protein [Alteribacter lacisalsi]|uniref:nuclease-related domain-containing protein n=1 Tax=Alteribacter lacisalsi TaxID=2045244 RepID=UPI001374C786|nr:nuclease-related domain-containing protein [Alteribacter lacisalsi]